MSAVDFEFSLADAYERGTGRVFLTGIQALVRLPLEQRRIDRKAGLSTAGLVSGYRGSPLGAYDQQLWKARKFLDAEDVVFQPGLNEDLAATALWGAQMHRAFGPTKADGVFGIWYGKGNGVDRTADVFRNANMLGTSPLGGVLAIGGDDHAAQSSMFPHQTDGIFQAVSMPVLQPASIAETLSLGLAGFALSRFSGLWVGMKTIAEVVESAGSVELPEAQPSFFRPGDFEMPSHGLNWDPSIQWPGQRAEFERRLIEERLPAAQAWARANRLDRQVAGGVGPFGIITVGKAHQDLLQALDDLQISERDLNGWGVGVYKVAMSWPLEPQGLRAFAGGRQELLVVEEKRPVVETQVRDLLYSSPLRPAVWGKTARNQQTLLPEVSEFTPLMVARAIVQLLSVCEAGDMLRAQLLRLEAKAAPPQAPQGLSRKPYFCSGCPHNTSTRTPEGSITGGGIGCHVMALSLPDRRTSTFCQMGGEGAQWIGAAPFSKTPHIFQNIGDGTYQHSGILAIRAAIAAKTNITFKVLYNDAVAMTGGQAAEGLIDPTRITRELDAEGVSLIALVSDEPGRWRECKDLASGVVVWDRDQLDIVQRQMRETPGVTAIVYDQTCAAEKRRRRKKGIATGSDHRLFINPRVCEGCGDCSVQSNCIAIEPLETPLGRKRQINQSACNTDFSCVKGFCPSFVEVQGATVRRPSADRLSAFEAERLRHIPTPRLPPVHGTYNVFVAGIGGGGVLTIGALLGVAAFLEGKASKVLDFTGLAQKNGAVVSQIQIALGQDDIRSARIGPAGIDLLLAADMVVASQADSMDRLDPARSHGVINIDVAPTADIVRARDMQLPVDQMMTGLKARLRPKGLARLNATRLAEGLFGDTVGANVLMLGFAWQRGLVPLSMEAIERAIELNGAAVAMNKRAFAWGRFAAVDVDAAERMAGIQPDRSHPTSAADITDLRSADLRAYQDEPYARAYRKLVSRTFRAGVAAGDHDQNLARAVAQSAYRLMAYKDEYEVARLYSEREFLRGLEQQFSDRKSVSLWLAPPLISRLDPATGRPKKHRFGPWVFTVFAVLAGLKGLRGTPLDPFGWTSERRSERGLIKAYFEMVEDICGRLTPSRLEAAVALASAPMEIRGFGPVKAQSITEVQTRMSDLKDRFDATAAVVTPIRAVEHA
jgi:indolepyruvate ferredoxin oxidoreductase